MKVTIEPEPTFSKWVAWSDRLELAEVHQPGVYMLAHLDEEVGSEAAIDPPSKQVVYIGETTRNSLKGRWRQFQRAVSIGSAPHAGGRTYRKKFGAAKLDDLAVAGFRPSAIQEEELPWAIKFVERWLLWRYARKWGELPACNKR